LSHQFREQLDITLVESEQIGTVGVGESTVPPIRTFHRFLQIDEQEFLQAVAGTFKLSISFENWRRPGERFIHPFGTIGQGTWATPFHHFWLDSLRRGMPSDLGDFCLESVASRGDRFSLQTQPLVNYAYHFDAGLYAKFLRRRAEAQGLRPVEGKIREVRQHAHDGSVAALVLEDGQVIEGDLFIDCTGFRGLLTEQTLHSGYEDWNQWLPSDRAVAVQTESVNPPVPYTRAIAHEAGWRWHIALQHRVGCGLVFSSRHLSDDEAQAKLLRDVEGPPLRDPWLVPFRSGRRLKAWNKNVVALGLASGFIEPLESTSIHLTISAVVRLIQLFPFDGITPTLTALYNDVSRQEMEHVRAGPRRTVPRGFLDQRADGAGHPAGSAAPAGARARRCGSAHAAGADPATGAAGGCDDAIAGGIHRALLQGTGRGLATEPGHRLAWPCSSAGNW